MTKKRAFSYIRMSTEAQLEGHSLARQLKLARDYAEEKGFELVEDLRDIGLSAHDGTNIEKGKLGVFLKAIESGELGKDIVLLVESLDRLSRQNARRAFMQLNEIIEYGIEVHTIFDRQIYTKQSLDESPGQIFASLGYMMRAHSESEEKSRRLKKRWQSNRENGARILTTICPAWLKANKEKTGFIEIPDRVDTITAIFDMSIDQGMGALAIARYLNKHPDKHPRFTLPEKANRGSDNATHKTGWHKSYVTKILNNPAVYGEFQPQEKSGGRRQSAGASRSNYFPAIISRERYLLAQAQKAARKQAGGGRKGDSFHNVFTKLIRCGECGGTVHFFDKGRTPKGGRYLRCNNAASGNKCKTKAWRYEEFEYNFFSFVSEVEFGAALQKGGDKSRKRKLLELQQIYSEEHKTKQIQLNNLVLVLGKVAEEAIARLSENLSSISSDLTALEDRLRKIAIELEQIDHRSSQKLHEEVINSIRKAQNELAPDELAAMRRTIHNQIRTVVERIELDGLKETDADEDRSYTVIFKNGHERMVFPYSTEDDGMELREMVFNPETARYDEGETIKLETTTFKFIGKIDLKKPTDLKLEPKKKADKKKKIPA